MFASTRKSLTKSWFGVRTFLSLALLLVVEGVWGITGNPSEVLQFDLTGRQLYNRPLFGSEPPFVTYGGDLPAFAISGGWYGGKLGNLHVVITTQDGTFAAHQAANVSTFYDGLALRYEIRDGRLKEGVVRLKVVASRAKGCLFHLVAEKLPVGTSVAWVYGGANCRGDGFVACGNAWAHRGVEQCCKG